MSKTVSKFALAAGVALALAFTFSCSGSSSEDPESPSSSSLQADVPSSSSDDAPSSSSLQLSAPLKAQPVAASNDPSEPKIAGSWTVGEKNYYVIDVGVIRRNFISAIFGPEHYDGFHPVQVAIKNINTSTITTSITETVSKSISVSNTLGVKLGLEEAIKANIPGIGDLSAKLNLEVSETINVSNGKTTSTSLSNITSYVESQETSRTMTFGSNGAPAGFYRYALYGTSDVYFVIETSLDNQTLLGWDVISCVRPGDYLRHNDYSPDGNFDNSPLIENQIVFAEDFYKTLPKPQPKVEKTEIKEFTASGTYTFNKSFPATIEVYALGAGGGGQGGNTSDWMNFLVLTTDHGTGGSGGGGAAAYMKLENVQQSIDFGITVGTGGSGGSTFYAGVNKNWESGYSGTNGSSTIVTWNGNTLTAAEGQGGGGNRSNNSNRDMAGGAGGAKSDIPPGVTSTAGGNGGSGAHDTSQRTGQGGSAGKITMGSVNPFPSTNSAGTGGNGGYTRDQVGSKGGNGLVVIVVKYYE